MPKKSTPARGGAQRNKPKAQKSFELVRPVSEVQNLETESNTAATTDGSRGSVVARVPATSSDVSVLSSLPTVPAALPDVSALSSLPTTPKKKEKMSSIATEEPPLAPIVPKASVPTESVAAPKGSAAARLAARRQATQKTQQRGTASLISAEHYSYVRKDLVFIAILAAIMFIALIVLYFVPGIGL